MSTLASNTRYLNRAIWPVAAVLYFLLPPQVLDTGFMFVVAHGLSYLGYAAGATLFIASWELTLHIVTALFSRLGSVDP